MVPDAQKPIITGIDLLMHDIKQPLLTISRLSSLLKAETENRDTMRLDRVLCLSNKLGMASDSLLKMIGPLLQIAILGDCPVDSDPPATFPVVRAIEQARCNVLALIEDSHGKVEVEGDSPDIFGNEERWVRVFQNMMKNGLKYNRSKTPTVSVRLQPRYLIVKDNGIGIDEDLWENIFTLSYRGVGTEFGDGTGAGLYIARKFVEWDGGALRVQQSSPRGTTFRIDLPPPMEV